MMRRFLTATLLAFIVCAPGAALAQSGTSWVLGGWRVTWDAAGGNYVGIMQVSDAGGGRYEASIDLMNTRGGAVRQRARVTVVGAQVTIDGYDIESTNMSGYSADNFIVTRQGDRMSGNSQDDAGRVGRRVEFFR
ncbi:MAG: hypothetical protein AB7J28_17145 [Hyphomonadaceae bacterium]